MRTVLPAILGALIGGAYEAVQTFELVRTGAYPLGLWIGVVLAGAAVGAAVFAAGSAVYRMLASRR